MQSSKIATLWQRAARRQVRALAQAGQQTRREMLNAVLAAHEPPPGQGQWLSGMAAGPAGLRRWRLFVPQGVSLRERLPLMVMLHGCGQDGHEFAVGTGMNRIAARERFLVLYPDQDRRAHPQGCWNWYDTRNGQALAEAATLAAAVEQVALMHPVDRQRIAVAGLSAGASMAALLGVRRPQLFRAVAMHSGVPPGAACSSATALRAMLGRGAAAALPLAPELLAAQALPPLLVLHGSADAVVSVRNAAAAAEAWAQAAGARCGTVRSVQRGQRHAMHVTDYKAGRRTVATLCEVQGLGHAWSGGAAQQRFSDPQGPDASRLVWRFASGCFAKG